MPGTTQPGTRRAQDVPRRGGSFLPARAGNRWTVLAVLCVSLLLVAVDATVLHVAVPAVADDLRPGPIELLWIVDVYPLVCAALLILFGTLGDRVGRRRVLMFGYGCFGLASVAAAAATTPTALLVARGLLGVGGAMIMPATLSILRQVFPDRRERALAIGIWSAVAAFGAAIGPLVGGVLLAHFWWGSVFLVNVPLMAGCLLAGARLLPESTGRRDGPWDVVGALYAAGGLFGVILAVKRAGGGQTATPGTVLAVLAGAVLLTAFVRRQRRRRHPLIDLTAFRRPAFGTSVGCIVLTVLALVGLALIAAQYMQLVLGLSALQTGLRLLPLSLAAITAGLLGSRLLQLLGPRTMVALGFLLTAAGVLTLLGLGEYDRPGLLLAGFVMTGFGLETTLFGAYESMLDDAPADQAGQAAAIGETAYQFGAGIGIAILGSVLNAVYAPRVPPQVVEADAGARGAADRSLVDAYATAEHLGGEAGELLRAAARASFVQGVHATLLVSAALLLLGAAAALRLPTRPPGRKAAAGPAAGAPPVPAEPPAAARPGPGRSAAAGRADAARPAPPPGVPAPPGRSAEPLRRR